MKYTDDIKNEIITKVENGEFKKTLSKEYDIPRGTIRYWYKNKNFIKKEKINISKIDKISYSYILGVYLGDGCIDKMKRTYRMRISLDSRQDLVIEECIKHLKRLFPENKINSYKVKNTNLIVIIVHSNILPILFPQLGNGHKHDGSFFIANGKYPRYQFTNKSKQILDIFGKCLNDYEITPKIRKRKNGIYDIQIQNKKDFEKLYKILGEKYK